MVKRATGNLLVFVYGFYRHGFCVDLHSIPNKENETEKARDRILAGYFFIELSKQNMWKSVVR